MPIILELSETRDGRRLLLRIYLLVLVVESINAVADDDDAKRRNGAVDNADPRYC